MILLDTHALLWLDAGDARLGPEARRAADEALAEDDLAVSAISFWEAAMLAGKGRIRLGQPPGSWRNELLEAGLTELAVTGEVGILAASLPDLPGDPADRIILATASVHGARFVTADEPLLAWNGDLRRLDARV